MHYNHFDTLEKGRTAKEEARELQLREEASMPERVREIQKNLSSILKALGEMSIADPILAHTVSFLP
ncbi:unnamed protein product [Prunus brigantina]